MAELIRCATGISMEEAGKLIELVKAPVGTLVEEIDGIRMVHAKVSVRREILILLHSLHPDSVASSQIVEWIGKNTATTRSRLSELCKERLIVNNRNKRDSDKGFKLTSTGYSVATKEILRLQNLRRIH